ncbi:DUF2778 domain-containing protein [Aquabacter sp. CN5-332]|uniref:DUF2778 domain-containing protein n=1 Tax=Aquabacter sp. CN5-332 TaxID=3156608 RepID=UPI0032B5C0BB
MTYTTLTFDDALESPLSKTKLQVRIFGALVGFSTIAAAMISTSDLGQMMRASAPVIQERATEIQAQAPVEHPLTVRPLAMVRLSDIGNFPSSGSISAVPGWMFDPAAGVAEPPPTETAAVEEALSPGEMPEVVRMTPLPPVNPRVAARAPATDDAEAAAPPLPAKNPLMRVERQLASLPPDRPIEDEPPIKGDVSLPGVSDRYAVYDIKAKTVYMPSGERLEAHSGYGDMFDDPRHVSKRMRGPTPPNTYNLTMREALFHGVEALRMNPVDRGKMYGRDGILAHTYMLGPRGDSNGCISFRDYSKFLSAYKRGEVKQIIVVASLPKTPAAANPLLSWLTPR